MKSVFFEKEMREIIEVSSLERLDEHSSLGASNSNIYVDRTGENTVRLLWPSVEDGGEYVDEYRVTFKEPDKTWEDVEAVVSSWWKNEHDAWIMSQIVAGQGEFKSWRTSGTGPIHFYDGTNTLKVEYGSEHKKYGTVEFKIRDKETSTEQANADFTFKVATVNMKSSETGSLSEWYNAGRTLAEQVDWDILIVQDNRNSDYGLDGGLSHVPSYAYQQRSLRGDHLNDIYLTGTDMFLRAHNVSNVGFSPYQGYHISNTYWLNPVQWNFQKDVKDPRYRKGFTMAEVLVNGKPIHLYSVNCTAGAQSQSVSTRTDEVASLERYISCARAGSLENVIIGGDIHGIWPGGFHEPTGADLRVFYDYSSEGPTLSTVGAEPINTGMPGTQGIMATFRITY